jgi:hypothetical protein
MKRHRDAGRSSRRRAPWGWFEGALERRVVLANPAPYVVTKTIDDGSAGTLRDAIDQVDAGVADTIDFHVGNAGVDTSATITVASALPSITSPVTIDGTSETSFLGQPAGTVTIEINGGGALGPGLFLAAGSDGSTIQSLDIDGFSGAQLDVVSNGNTVVGNEIGTNLAGSAAAAGFNLGVIVSGSQNRIGGPGAGNVIAFSMENGITISRGTGNTLSQNRIAQNAASGIALVNGGNDSLSPPNVTAGITVSDALNGGQTEIVGSLNGLTLGHSYTVEFFVSAQGAPATGDQAQVYLGDETFPNVGATSVTLSPTALTLPAIYVGQRITATLTDTTTHDTSYFAAPVTVSTPTQSPPLTIALEAASDTGTSHNDGITDKNNSPSPGNAPVFDVGGVEAGATVNLLRNGTVVNTMAAPNGGTVPIADINSPGGGAIADGTYSYTAEEELPTGAQLETDGQANVTIITQVAAPGAPVFQSPNGAGAQQSVTSENNNPSPANAPVFAVAGAKPGAMVELLRNGTVVNTVIAATGATVSIADINSPTNGAIPDGRYAYSAIQIDVAGNVSAPSTSTTLTISTLPPAPLALALDPASQNGLGPTTTVVRRPTFDVTGAAAGATLTLTIKLGMSLTTLAPVAASSTGTATFAPTFNLSDGHYTVAVTYQNVADATATASIPLFVTSIPGDYSDAGHADLSVFRRVNAGLADFFVDNVNPPGAPAFGSGTLDIPFQGDLDGDGKTDLILFRPSTATYYMQESSAGFVSTAFGEANVDIPALGDFDGTGNTELAVYRPTTGQWFVAGHSKPFVSFGGDPSDTPVPGNYIGLGRDQVALFRQSADEWFIGGYAVPIPFGGPGDVPVPGDYDGIGLTEVAVYRPSTGQWFIGGHATADTINVPGYVPRAGDIPAPGNYDGTGKMEEAIYRPSTGQWFIQNRSQPTTYGGPTDIPLASPYLYRSLSFSTRAITASSLDALVASGSIKAMTVGAPDGQGGVAPVQATSLAGADSGRAVAVASPAGPSVVNKPVKAHVAPKLVDPGFRSQDGRETVRNRHPTVSFAPKWYL